MTKWYDFLSSFSEAQVHVWTRLRGEHVGTDALGNQYYRRSARLKIDLPVEDSETPAEAPETYEDVYGNIVVQEHGGKLKKLIQPLLAKLNAHMDADAENNQGQKERRWVVYNGEPEASKVAPEWHAWLHHTTDDIPSETNPLRRSWQKPYEPNLTGTDQAWHPPGHVLEGGKRAKASADYQAWSPPE